jgi:hypothetical protein
MLATFDLPEVRRFVNQLSVKRAGCLEGNYCSRLDERIQCQLQVCKELNDVVWTWTFRVFRGQIPHNPEVEIALREQVGQTLEAAQEVVSLAREREAECFEFARLDELSKQVRKLNRLEAKWASPRVAVRPAYRKSLTPAEISTMRAGIARLSPFRAE